MMGFCFSEKDVWKIEDFDSLLSAIENGGDITNVLKARHKSHIIEMEHDAEYVRWTQDIQKNIDNQKQIKADLKKLDTLQHKLSEYKKDKTEILQISKNITEIYDFDYEYYLKHLFSVYESRGVFDKDLLEHLKQKPSKMISRLLYARQIKRIHGMLDNFIKKYTDSGLYNLIYQDGFFEKDKGQSFDYYSKKINVLIPDKDRSFNWSKSSVANLLQIKENIEQEYNKKTAAEDKVIRSFANQIIQDILNPKDIKSSEWVERLEGMSDDEMVMFDILTTARYSADSDFNFINEDRNAVFNILKYNCLSQGVDTKDWFLDQGEDTCTKCIEIFSPIMRVSDAKKIIPRLLSNLHDADLVSNLVIAMRPNELLGESSGKSQPVKDNAVATIMDAIMDKKIKAYSYKSDVKSFELYPDKKYLSSGAMISDDYKFLSRRQGRCGISYTTPFFSYAFIYTGLKYFLQNEDDGGARKSPTQDVYPERNDLSYNGKPVRVGFVNIYEKNLDQDRFFVDFGIERTLASKYVEVDDDKGIETFVTPEKNRLIDKVICFVWNKQAFLIPMNQEYPVEIKNALHSVVDMFAGRMEDTLPGKQFAKRRSRFQSQRQEYENGLVHENDTLKRLEDRRNNLKQRQYIGAMTNDLINLDKR